MHFKLCLVAAMAITVFTRSVNAEVCDMQTFWEETKLDLPSPKSSNGKCLYDCMFRANDMLGDNGLVDSDKFMKSLKATGKIPTDALDKLKTAVDKCKRKIDENKCETAALFVQCASEESAKFGYKPTDVAKTIRLVYLYFVVEHKGEWIRS